MKKLTINYDKTKLIDIINSEKERRISDNKRFRTLVISNFLRGIVINFPLLFFVLYISKVNDFKIRRYFKNVKIDKKYWFKFNKRLLKNENIVMELGYSFITDNLFYLPYSNYHYLYFSNSLKANLIKFLWEKYEQK